MTIQIKHPFVSAKGDGGDATLVRPSNWNAVHSTSMATGQLVGRLSAGVGAFEEIPLSAYMAGLFGAADATALAGLLGLFETGDVKYTLKTTASAGWVLIQGGTGAYGNTIGNAASGAGSRANADCQALFLLIYAACSDAIAPVSGGRTGIAINDFNANKTIRVPDLVGRSPIGAGTATNDGTIARVLGTLYGGETTTLVTGNLPPYTPSGTVAVTSNGGPQVGYLNTATSTNVGYGGTFTGASFTQPTFSGSFTGSPQGGASTPLSVLHPVVALNAMVKL